LNTRDDRLVTQMAGRRYCHVLTAENSEYLDDATAATAWMALEEDMSMVLGGVLNSGHRAQGTPGGSETVVEPFYLDRYAVTNADFAHFVNAGAYSEMDLWPKAIWANVLQFVDSTGLSGPRFWANGKPPRHQAKHPVVGVSWYEANAYATWVGKSLPTSAEWELAGSWPSGLDGRSGKVRYPWGNSFDPAKSNTWIGGPGKIVAVDEYYNGCTPNGIYQLVGNVWEWVATPYTCRTGQGGLTVEVDQPMGEIRGGAFDTYFETQATCQFRTGQPLLYRGANVGFRCCVDAGKLRQPPQPAAFL
jgi:iron(II)-dependent oxidoreductase